MTETTELLRADILSGHFQPGARLVEVQLSERYEVGRAAIRTAIVELSAEGLVVHEANRGATVRRVPIEAAIEITQARAVLEGLLARFAAEKATDEERAELQSIVGDMRDAVDLDDQAAYSGLNRVLHRRVCEVARHSIASDLVANLRHQGRQQEFQLSRVPGRSAVSLRQHEAIVQAIVDGDGRGAEAVMHAHLESVEDALRAWVVD